MHVCELAFRDIHGKWCLISIFNYFQIQSLPSRLNPFFMFATVADVGRKGSYLITVEDPIGLPMWTSGHHQFESPSKDADFYFQIPSLTVVRLGEYRVSLHINGDRVADVRFEVKSSGAPVVI